MIVCQIDSRFNMSKHTVFDLILYPILILASILFATNGGILQIAFVFL